MNQVLLVKIIDQTANYFISLLNALQDCGAMPEGDNQLLRVRIRDIKKKLSEFEGGKNGT